jgi:hypothetical protein
MAIQMTKQKNIEKLISEDKLDICQRCKNAYILIWLTEGEDYNDFGLRYCPFCGLLIDEITGSIVE